MSGTWTDGRHAGGTEEQAPVSGHRVPVWAWWLVLGITLLVLGGVAAVIWADANSGDSSKARATAEAYLDAVEAGDADEANGHARVDKRSRQTELLRSDVLEEADERISDVDLGRLRVDSERGSARGTVEYRLDGRRYSDRLELARDSDGWYVRDGLTVELPFDWSGEGGPFALAGFDEVLSGAESLEVYPAVYGVEAPNEFFEVVGDGRMVAAPESTDLFGDYERAPEHGVWTRPTDAYWDEMRTRVAEWYDDCAEKGTAAELRSCGIEIDVPISAVAAEFDVEVVREPGIIEGYGWQTFEVDTDGEFLARPKTDGGASELSGRNSYADASVEISSDGEMRVEVTPY